MARVLTAVQRRCAGQAGCPPPDVKAVSCGCGTVYLDYPDGRDAHEAVMGHPPVVRPVKSETEERA